MGEVHKNPPYTLAGRFYDQWISRPRMNRQARRKLLAKILPKVQSCCDLGCGTGSTAVDLARRGFRVFAVDVSREMCRKTRARARQERVRLKVIRADMRGFRLPALVDLVTCEFNALNCLPHRKDLALVLRAVRRALRPGGYFLFDAATRRSYKPLEGFLRISEGRGFFFTRRGRFDARRKRATIDVHWFLPAGRLWRRYHEPLHVVFWEAKEIRRALARAGFRVIRVVRSARVRPALTPPDDLYFLARNAAERRAGVSF
jgi:SAM-dependent methyltransferase